MCALFYIDNYDVVTEALATPIITLLLLLLVLLNNVRIPVNKRSLAYLLHLLQQQQQQLINILEA